MPHFAVDLSTNQNAASQSGTKTQDIKLNLSQQYSSTSHVSMGVTHTPFVLYTPSSFYISFLVLATDCREDLYRNVALRELGLVVVVTTADHGSLHLFSPLFLDNLLLRVSLKPPSSLKKRVPLRCTPEYFLRFA